jgi:hypothetical protein
MSKIEVNQISSQCGSTLTIGQSGDTVTLACGATQTGFGRTGTVDWCTTAKTAPFTGVSGKGYFVNTTCGAVTVTLPATPTAGDIVAIKDYARTAGTNNINFCRNGSKMDGNCFSSGITTSGDSTTLIYVDGTKGWTSILDNTTAQYGATYITATGGTITTCGDYKVHTFTSDSCFSVSAVGNAGGSDSVDYIVVAGGGGAGSDSGGGGGAGGYREGYNPGSYTASPLATTSLPVSATTYPITVGAGGSGGAGGGGCGTKGTNGSNSVFSTITSAGGGGGGTHPAGAGSPGNTGGSGGGSRDPVGTGGAGNTPPTSPPQGQPGATSSPSFGGIGAGGGGATSTGTPGVNGGTGATSSINGTPTQRAGGGGGGGNCSSPGGSATGGGGAGKSGPALQTGNSGTANTGGGGGGGSDDATGGTGGSGVVLIRYKFQN